jgi:hypothetical protein
LASGNGQKGVAVAAPIIDPCACFKEVFAMALFSERSSNEDSGTLTEVPKLLYSRTSDFSDAYICLTALHFGLCN